jgi:hypothetical protein
MQGVTWVYATKNRQKWRQIAVLHLLEELTPYQEGRLMADLTRKGYTSETVNGYTPGTLEYQEFNRGVYDDAQAEAHKAAAGMGVGVTA